MDVGAVGLLALTAAVIYGADVADTSRTRTRPRRRPTSALSPYPSPFRAPREPPLSELEGGSLAPWSLVPHISHEVENSEFRNEQLGHSLTTIESRASGLRACQM